MNKYETLFIIKPNLADEQVEAVVSRLTERIGLASGKVAAIDYWGLRRLAYPILYRGERFRRGYYVLLTYVGDGKTVEEVERNIKILDDSFRYLTVKLVSNVDPASIGEASINKRSSEPPAEAPVPKPEAPVETASATEPAVETPAGSPGEAPTETTDTPEPAAAAAEPKDEE